MAELKDNDDGFNLNMAPRSQAKSNNKGDFMEMVSGRFLREIGSRGRAHGTVATRGRDGGMSGRRARARLHTREGGLARSRAPPGRCGAPS